MQTSRRQQTCPTKPSLNLVNQFFFLNRLWTKFLLQPEPEFRPPMSEVVQALVRLVQRANMTKRMLDGDTSRRADDQDSDFIWRKQNTSLSGCIYFVRLAPSREREREREKIWKKKQRSLLVPPVHNHSFFMVTKECILWSMVCIVHTKQYLDRRFIPFYCILWLDYMQMHLIKQDYGVRFAEC